jgi:diguanylate cyclase (GGDEF)-like protein/PAS domain S-box-containing protein
MIEKNDNIKYDNLIFKSDLYENIFNLTNDGIIVLDKNFKIKYVNYTFCNISNYQKDELIDKYISFLMFNKNENIIYKRILKSLINNMYWQGEIWNKKKDAEEFLSLVTIKQIINNYDNNKYYVCIFADKTEKLHSEKQFEYLAYHDMLTKLPNRLLLMTQLEESLKNAKRNSIKVALLFLDLDRFKYVNDSFGHAMGDELLQKVALRLRNRLREVDMISRFGGDEFAILLPSVSEIEDAGIIAKKIISIINEPWLLSNKVEIRIGVSIGISIYDKNHITADEMLQFADAALYRAKEEGKGIFTYYKEEMTIKARNKIEIETQLRRACENNEFLVHYQPQIDIKTGNLLGAEALVRWNHPIKGVIYPDDFISIAEETGIIFDIGIFVLEEVCIQAKKWEKEEGLKDFKFCINISAYQLEYENIVEIFSNIINRIGYSPNNIELEITESALIKNKNKILFILHKFRTLGFKLSIDDFGTGYSSLSYLKKFPLDILKIDKSFIKDIPFDKDDMDIAIAIIQMGHALGFKVIAEGVEKKEQLDFLLENKGDYYQGYLGSKPIGANEFKNKYLKTKNKHNI